MKINPIHAFPTAPPAKELPVIRGESGISRIRRMVADPHTDPLRILCEIGAEQAKILDYLWALLRHQIPVQKSQLERYLALSDCLCQIERTVMAAQAVSRDDHLYFDGEKFHFVLNTLLEWFCRAMREVGGPVDATLKCYSEIAREGWPEVRRILDAMTED